MACIHHADLITQRELVQNWRLNRMCILRYFGRQDRWDLNLFQYRPNNPISNMQPSAPDSQLQPKQILLRWSSNEGKT